MNISKEQFKVIVEQLKADSGIYPELENDYVSSAYTVNLKDGYLFTFDFKIWAESDSYLYGIEDMTLYSVDLGCISLEPKDFDLLEKLAKGMIELDFSEHEGEAPEEHAYKLGY